MPAWSWSWLAPLVGGILKIGSKIKERLAMWGLKVQPPLARIGERPPAIERVEGHGGADGRLVVFNSGGRGKFSAWGSIVDVSQKFNPRKSRPFRLRWESSVGGEGPNAIIKKGDFGSIVLGRTKKIEYPRHEPMGELQLLDGVPRLRDQPYEVWRWNYDEPDPPWVTVRVTIRAEPELVGDWTEVYRVKAKMYGGVEIERLGRTS